MVKSGLISLFVLLLLAAAAYIGLFDMLATSSALWTGIGASIFMLLLAVLILGNPLKK